ncbi:SAVED domain-containing protein [Bacillus cereus]|uniref:Hachiman antiphage defense system protein HamA n=1 Tax=Bacillus toyonensis TaxID=155322 RepID=UPI002A3F19BB|nr:SAVED domain-containing protein [Bacillus cereus]MDA2443256.1 SAVED domain-containing protein [Bacillus cereus]
MKTVEITAQTQLIGNHPDDQSLFAEWVTCEDLEATTTRKHRKLIENSDKREVAIDGISEWIIKHHVDEEKLKILKKRKAILRKHELDTQAVGLPTVDKTVKGNIAEIILAEYLQKTTGLKLFIYRLRYNPNINQSMKGDDVLLLNEADLCKKVIVGESKFRLIPGEAAVTEVTREFGGKVKLPLSIPFIAQVFRDRNNYELADELEQLNSILHLGKTEIVNVGFLLSNHNSAKHVEKHLISNNPNFIFISLSLQEPGVFIYNSIRLVEEKLKGYQNEY